MTVLEAFYGRELQLPDDLHYQLDQHMWLKEGAGGVELGFSQAGIILVSGVVFLDFIAEEGQELEAGDPLLALEAYKAMFQVACPLAGKVLRLNQEVAEEKATRLDREHYQLPVALMEPARPRDWSGEFLDARAYAEALEQGAGDHCGAGARAARSDPSRKT